MPDVIIIPAGAETDEQYHRSGAWGSTLIGHFRRSPKLAHLIRTGQHQPKPTASMTFGRWFHHLMDRGFPFTATFRQGPDVDRRTKAWTAAVEEATKDHITLIPHDDWLALYAMRESVLGNGVARGLLEGAEQEVGFRMSSPYGNFQLQCRADVLRRWTLLSDLKTTADVDDFAHSVRTYGYHRQAVLYQWIVSQAGGELLPFSFIAAEKDGPLYRCRVFDLDPVLLEQGWSEVETALIEIGERTAKGDWNDHRDADIVTAQGWPRSGAAA